MPALDAVRVMTHHAAKGLEWPVVILTDLDKSVRNRLWGISTVSRQTVDAMHPLENRFIRYWPWPFGQQSAGIAVNDRIEASSAAQQFADAAQAEAQRLLYVSMTRPRELLILATKQKAKEHPWLDTLNAEWLSSIKPGDCSITLPGGTSIPASFEYLAPRDMEPSARPEQMLHWWPTAEPQLRQPRNFNPSLASAALVSIRETVQVGERLSVGSGVQWDVLGTAIHACLAASFTDTNCDTSLEDTERILGAYVVSSKIDAIALAKQVLAIRDWVLRRWPGCCPLAETPLFAKLANGQRLVGRIDLLLLTKDGIVILDHKSTPAGPHQWSDLAQSYAGQLETYAAGVEQVTEQKVLETWLVLPVAGACIALSNPAQPFQHSPPTLHAYG